MYGINKKKTLLVRYECSHICIRSLRKKVTSKKKKEIKKFQNILQFLLLYLGDRYRGMA